MATSLRYIDWENRPAVLCGARAYAVLCNGENWTEVNFFEVTDSEYSLSLDDFRTDLLRALQDRPSLSVP